MMLLAQISDLHILSPGATHVGGIDPSDRVRRALTLLSRLRPRIAALLITGDLAENGESAEYEHLRLLLGELAGIPVYLLPGNHDHAPTFRRVFADHDYFANPERAFFVRRLGGLQLVGLDTSVPEASHGVLGAEQLQWLDQTLKSSPGDTLIAMHHPPFASSLGAMDQWGLADSEGFHAHLSRYRCVRMITAGHLHRSASTNIGAVRVNVCPSTAFSISLDLHAPESLGWCDEGGFFQIHHFDMGRVVTWTVACNAKPGSSLI